MDCNEIITPNAIDKTFLSLHSAIPGPISISIDTIWLLSKVDHYQTHTNAEDGLCPSADKFWECETVIGVKFELAHFKAQDVHLHHRDRCWLTSSDKTAQHQTSH